MQKTWGRIQPRTLSLKPLRMLTELSSVNWLEALVCIRKCREQTWWQKEGIINLSIMVKVKTSSFASCKWVNLQHGQTSDSGDSQLSLLADNTSLLVCSAPFCWCFQQWKEHFSAFLDNLQVLYLNVCREHLLDEVVNTARMSTMKHQDSSVSFHCCLNFLTDYLK